MPTHARAPAPHRAAGGSARAGLPVLALLALLGAAACGGEPETVDPGGLAEQEEAGAPPAEAPDAAAERPAPPPERAAEPLDLPEPETPRAADIHRRAAETERQVIDWRRHLHEHPELSNREHETAALVAGELEALGLEMRTGIAHTGVVGILRGGARPTGGGDATEPGRDGDGPVVALRADMDALPVSEQTGLPFASEVRTTYRGQEVGVMHACGHDAHVAILLGTARVLAGMRDALSGTVLFVFQPAEEGAPPGEEGGAELMLAEGAFDDPEPDAVFGLHVVPDIATGEVGWRAGGAMASSDQMKVVVRGSQTHAAYPWRGVDPIAGAAHVVLALQAIPARRVDTRIPGVVSVGSIHGGVRNNIIPDEVELLGTIRALDPELREALHGQVRETAERAAAVVGARAEVVIERGYPVTWNDPELARRALPTLRRVAGAERVVELPSRTGAEDFSFFARRAPGLYFWLGIRPPDVAPEQAAPNHSPHFTIDERALGLGVRLFSNLAFDFLEGESG